MGHRGISAPGLHQFWSRRVEQSLDGQPYLALHPADALGYTALHLLRHLSRGDVRAANVYELAYFLDRNAANALFWNCWRDLHGPELRRLQALGFGLAAAWSTAGSARSRRLKSTRWAPDPPLVRRVRRLAGGSVSDLTR